MRDSADDSFMADGVAAVGPSAPNVGSGRPTILVCEDEPLIRMNLVDLLDELGYDVREAVDAGNALELMTTSPVDILITDLGLPDMSGELFARTLRDRWPLLPILFATGRGREDRPRMAGPSGYLAKPFTMKTLSQALADLSRSGAGSAD